ncbi:hypothetical protein H8S90_01210 [Olivibacter sp. SDN3]|uniref:sigma factor-like helix-turn-helix DNA-binding protein n=1 Tax=unclassified Olivibacter TaxID=2632301 RepID=UPI0016515DB9|nr:sigma factor-like helix-turn-helix DNA-binding protein [Olivibacter sp. SDN3]QNL50279.1 hypothetical protein H8S90_01210 [Olivibacter sp. SDN3]
MKCDVIGIWHEKKGKLKGFVYKRSPQYLNPEEIMNEVLVKMYLYCLKKADIKNIESWLCQIAKNTIYDYKKDATRFTELQPESPAIGWPSIETHNARRWIEPLLQLIPVKYAEPVRLADLENIQQKAIAKSLGLTLTATKSRIQRGRKLLRQKFLECGIIEKNETDNYIYTVTEPCCLAKK